MRFCDEYGFGPLIADGTAFSPCFSQSVVEPLLYCIFIYIAQGQQLSIRHIPSVIPATNFSSRFNFKLGLCFMQILYPSLLSLFILGLRLRRTYSIARFASYGLRTLAWIICTRLLVSEYSKAIIQNTTIRNFWFIQFAVDSVACLVPHAGEEELLTILYSINFAISLVLAILSLFPDDVDVLALLNDPSQTVTSDTYYSLDGDEDGAFSRNLVHSTPNSDAWGKVKSTTPLDPFTYTANSFLNSAGGTESVLNETGYFGATRENLTEDGARFTPSSSEAKMWQKYLQQSTIESASGSERALVGEPKISVEVTGCSVLPEIKFHVHVEIEAEFDFSAKILSKVSETRSVESQNWTVKRSVPELLKLDEQVHELIPGEPLILLPKELLRDPSQINKSRTVVSSYLQQVCDASGFLFSQTFGFLYSDADDNEASRLCECINESLFEKQI